MSIRNFLTKENATLLWEVLMDDKNIKSKPREVLLQLNKVFNQNIESFYEFEKKNANSLIELNKKFITLMLQFVNKNYPQRQIQNEIDVINQMNNSSKKELYTSDDIKAERVSQFDKDLQLRQQDFTNAMSLPVPPKPKFNDEFTEQPIGEMEEIIRRTIAQRNYDVQQVNKMNNPEQAKEWLKSNETTIKKDYKNDNSTMNTNDNKIKYIRIEQNDLDNNIIQGDIIDIDINDNKNKKQISWADESDKTDETNIFSKLKHIPTSQTEENSLKSLLKHDDREKIVIENENNEKIKILENKIDILQNKIDIILSFITSSNNSNSINNTNPENIQLKIDRNNINNI